MNWENLKNILDESDHEIPKDKLFELFPVETLNVDLFSADGQEKLKPYKASLEIMRSHLLAMYKQNDYAEYPFRKYMEFIRGNIKLDS